MTSVSTSNEVTEENATQTSESGKSQRTKRAYQSPHVRNPKAFRHRLTSRDTKIIMAVAKYRFLNVVLIHKLLFPPDSSRQTCSRRVKKLFHGNYLNRVMPFYQGVSGSAACAYCLGQKGIELLREMGEEVKLYNTSSKKSPMFLHHALAVSEFAIIISKALESHPFLCLHNILFDFELKATVDQVLGNQKYLLYSELTHPTSK